MSYSWFNPQMARPDLSHLDEITLRRVLGKLALTIGDWEHTFSPEQEAKLWEQIQELVYKERDIRVDLYDRKKRKIYGQ